MLNEILNVILPGRRRLRALQTARTLQTIERQEFLLQQFHALSDVKSSPTPSCRLGCFDFDAFSIYIRDGANSTYQETTKARHELASLPDMSGGVNRGDQQLIFHLTRFLKPKQILEIGTHIGASTSHFAIAMAEYASTQEHVDTVDIRDVNCATAKPWASFGSKCSPVELIEKINATKYVSFHVATATEFLEATPNTYDLIFLDGDHSADAVYREIPLAMNKLKDGGVILLHDYFPDLRPLWSGDISKGMMHMDVIPGVYLAVNRLIKEGCQIKVTPFGELPWPTKLGSNVTSLALLSSV
jgi:predicted O-methyltransferase YrrM